MKNHPVCIVLSAYAQPLAEWCHSLKIKVLGDTCLGARGRCQMGHRAISVTSLGKRRQVGNYGNAYNDRPPSPSRAQNLVLAQLYTNLGSTW